MFLLYLFIGSLATLLGQGFSAAIEGQILSSSSTEKFSKYVAYEEKKTWDDARDFCDEHNMALAYIMTYQEQKELREFVRSNNLLPKDENSGYWLGARADQKIWRWEYNEENPRENSNFMAGWHWHTPDYKVNKDGEVAECMELKYINTNKFDRSLSWNDLWCNEKRGFICQIIDSTDTIVY